MHVDDWRTAGEVDRVHASLRAAILANGDRVVIDHETARALSECLDQLRDLMRNTTPLRR